MSRTVRAIQALKVKAGIVLNPATPLAAVEEILPAADFVLLMSVNPGFGGQAFIPGTLGKLRQVRSRIDAQGRQIRLEVDGGIRTDNIRAVAEAGAGTFVAGSAIFGSGDYAATIAAMRKELAAATARVRTAG